MSYQRKTVPISKYKRLLSKTRLIFLFSVLTLVIAILAITIFFPPYLKNTKAASYDYTVNSTNDVNDGTCDGTHCSLREAIKAVDATAGNKTIGFSVTGTITLSTWLDPVSVINVSITGPGADQLTIDGAAANADTVFRFTASGGNISGLKIANAGYGSITYSTNGSTINGGSIQNVTIDGSEGTPIYLIGSDTLGGDRVTNITISNNTISNSDTGAIFALDIANVTISSNTITGTDHNVGIYIGGPNCSTGNLIQNNTISGTHTSGIHLDPDSITVSGNTISGAGEWGIRVYNGSDSDTVQNNTISTCTNGGIIFQDSDNSVISGNTLNSNSSSGLGLTGSNNTISSNTTNSNASSGITISSGSTGNTIQSNTSRLNTNNGLSISSSSLNLIDQNTFSSNIQCGISLSGSDSNTIQNNTANSNTQLGITFNDSDSNTITGNTTNSNTMSGISINTSTGNTIQSNTSRLNTANGIYLGSSSAHLIDQNTCSSNTSMGIFLDNADSNTIQNNTASSNSSNGFYLQNGSDSNSFTSNISNSNTNGGIYINNSDSNTFTGNTSNSSSTGTGYGIDLTSGSGLNSISNNTFNGNALGMLLSNDNTEQNIITGNTINNTATYHGIFMYDSADSNTISNNTINTTPTNQDCINFYTDSNLISANTLTSCGRDGISLMEDTGSGGGTSLAASNTIQNNTISSVGQNGIDIGAVGTPGTGNKVTGNTISSSTQHGIYILNTDSATVSSNTVYSNSRNGIYLSSSDSNQVTSNIIYSNASTATYSATFNYVIYNGTSYVARIAGWSSEVDYLIGNTRTVVTANDTDISGLNGTQDLYLGLVHQADPGNDNYVTIYTTKSESDLLTWALANISANCVVDYYSTSNPIWEANGAGSSYTWNASALPSGGTLNSAYYSTSILMVNYGGSDYNQTWFGTPAVFYVPNFVFNLMINGANNQVVGSDGTTDLDLVLLDDGGAVAGKTGWIVDHDFDMATTYSMIFGVTPTQACRENNVFQANGTAQSYSFKSMATWTGCTGASMITGYANPATMTGYATTPPTLTAGYIYSGIELDTAVSNTLSHNSLYNNGSGITLSNASTSNIIKDNIIDSLANGLNIGASASATNTYNIVWATNGTTNLYVNSATQGTGERLCNPSYNNAGSADFTLKDWSCAIEGASDGSDIGAKDYTGTDTNTITVAPSGANYTSIQSAIEASWSGYTITVGAGTYSEDLTIYNKPSLTITGASQSTAIVDGTTTPLSFTGTTSSNTISGFTFTSATNGISFANTATSNTISDSAVSSTTAYDLIHSSSGTNTFHNVSFDYTKRNITAGELDVYFDTRAYVIEPGGSPLSSATVSLKDSSSTTTSLGTTGSNGYTSYTSLHPFNLTSAGVVSSKNPFTATTTKDSYLTKIQDFTINSQNQTLSITLTPAGGGGGSGTPHTPPTPPPVTPPIEPPITSGFTYPASTLIKFEGDNTVYVLDGQGEKKPIPSDELLNNQYNLENIITLPQSQLSSYPSAGGFQAFRSGTLLKADNSSKVYFVENNTLRYIEDETAFLNLGFKWENIVITDPANLNSYLPGQPLTQNTTIHPTGTLVKSQTDPKVYLIENGERKHIFNEDAFLANNYQWKEIVVIPDSELVLFKQGPELYFPTATLIKSKNSPKVYLVTKETTISYIPDENTFLKLGFKWSQVIETEDAVLAKYQVRNAVSL